MGGGDLNSKKSWHPNTLKNQERVWKAEQIAAEEKKRIMELKRECAEEKEQAELNNMAKRLSGTAVDDNRLHWMYDKPDKKAKDEDYLLGKAVDSNFDKNDKPESYIPAVARRVVGSSMLTAAGDTQVDLARKMREDPLLLVKERERAARAALLNNPIHRRRITELLRKEQEQKKKKVKKSKKKDSKKSKEKDLDRILASKLNVLECAKVDIASLLESGDSTSNEDASSDLEKKKKKKTKKHKKKKSKTSNKDSTESVGSSCNEESSSDLEKQKKKNKKKKSKIGDKDSIRRCDTPQSSKNEHIKERMDYGECSKKHSIIFEKQELKKKCKINSDILEREDKAGKRKRDISYDEKRNDKRQSESDSNCKKQRHGDATKSESHSERKRYKNRRYSSDSSKDHIRLYSKDKSYEKYKSVKSSHFEQEKKPKDLSKEEKNDRLKAMMEAGAEREKERGQRVAEQRVADAFAEKIRQRPRSGYSAAHYLPDSLESRIHSNRHYIQRDKRHMNEHFARR